MPEQPQPTAKVGDKVRINIKPPAIDDMDLTGRVGTVSELLAKPKEPDMTAYDLHVELAWSSRTIPLHFSEVEVIDDAAAPAQPGDSTRREEA